jgi:rhomboid protease GluP
MPCGGCSRRRTCAARVLETVPAGCGVSAQPPVTVFRSPRRRPCEERLLVLTALAIEAAVTPAPGEFLLQVAGADAAEAERHLAQYEAENRAPPPPPPPPRLHSHAWVGCVLYAATLLAIAWAAGSGMVRLDAFDRGELDCARVQAGEWWRAWTALTLHLDGPHLAANLGAGIWFGYLAARQLGVGAAWLLIVTGAALANLAEGLGGPPQHLAVGASTAVFTALGLMSAYSWRERLHWPQHWVRRSGPLVAGVILLGWLGSAGEGTDLVAHVAGFVVGALLGVAAALPAVRRCVARLPQWAYGAAALGSLVVAWGFALYGPST